MRKHFIVVAACVTLAAGLAGCGKKGEPEAPGRTRVGLVAKSLGNGFFDAVKKGGEEAAQELDAELIFTGPTTPTAEGQIEVLNALIAQRVDAIAVSANDPDALVPTLKKSITEGTGLTIRASGSGHQEVEGEPDGERLGGLEGAWGAAGDAYGPAF